MTKKAPVFVAVLDTRHYSFMAVGRTENEARAAMRAGWDQHCKDMSMRNSDSWSDFADGVNVVELRAGQSARDYSLLADLYG